MATDSATQALNKLNQSVASGIAAFDNLNKAAASGGIGFDKVAAAASAVNNNLSGAISLMTSFADKLSLGALSPLTYGLNKVNETFGSILGVGGEAITLLNSFGKAMDVATAYTRDLNEAMYKNAAGFGKGFEEAKKYSDYIMTSAQQFATAEFGFITTADRVAVAKTMADAGISIENMSKTITSAAGSMDLLNTAFLHSSSLGMTLTDYMKGLSSAMMVQGLSAQDAVEQMAMFGDISADTGLKVSKIADNLDSFASNLSKLGVNASFGRPALEGFADSLEDMGLGMENALSLSTTLSNSLVGLSSNYSAAYLTFQRGGLDIGSGQGALGASIGLRARLAEGGDQSELAMDLANAMKNTLSSFAGGNIVTVSEADKDPRLQQAFFTQTQLLSDIYKITDTATQDRTLELLEKLNEANKSGDQSLAESLGTDLQEIISARNQTTSYEEKTAASTASTYVELQLLNKKFTEGVRLSADTLAALVGRMQREGVDRFRGDITEFNRGYGNQPIVDFNELGEEVFDKIKTAAGNIDEFFEELRQEFDDLFNKIRQTQFGSAAATAVDGTTDVMNVLISKIDLLINSISGTLTAR